MLVLFETPAGYALFKVLDEGLLKKPESVWESFENPSKASKAYVSGTESPVNGVEKISLFRLMFACASSHLRLLLQGQASRL
jgi:hypothetical protein